MRILRWLNPLYVLRFLDRLERLLIRFEPQSYDPRNRTFWK